MRITIVIPATADGKDQGPVHIDAGIDMTQADLKGIVEADTQIPSHHQALIFNGETLQENTRTLGATGLQDGDVLELQDWRAKTHPPSHRPQPLAGDPAEQIRVQALASPDIMEQLRRQMPRLAAAVNDSRQFREIWLGLRQARDAYVIESARDAEYINHHPMNIEGQKRIEERIREQLVMENLESTMENHPESFGRVHMLYVPTEVNGHPVKAFVDSGAQATIISPTCAEECGILHLIDKRFAGIARGAGTAKILGKVHTAQIKVGSLFLPCSFTVMEGSDVRLLFGLDMLKRYQASIDLKKNALILMDEEIPFLAEADLPKGEMNCDQFPPGPSATAVGGAKGPARPPPPPTIIDPLLPPSGRTSLGSSEYSRGDIGELMGLGFSEAKVLEALKQANGNMELAAGILYR